MSARVSVRVVSGPGIGPSPGSAPDGRGLTAVAVKVATTPEEMDRLAGEADLLRRVRHPGLVTYVDHRATAERAELHTVFVGESLERWRGTVDQAAGLTAALAANLADLHDLGLVHGRIDRSHVLVEPGGRPVVCGLSPPDDDASPPDDVAGVGRVLKELLAAAAADPRAHRWRAVLQPGRQRALARIVAHATDPVATRRPTARALAGSLLAAVPGAQLAQARTEKRPDRPAEQELFAQAFVDQHDTGEEEIFVDRPWEEPQEPYPPGALPTGRHPPPQLRPTRRNVSTAAAIAGALVLTSGLVVWVLRSPAEETAGTPPADCPAPDADRHRGQDEDVPAGSETYEADVDGDHCPEQAVVTPERVVMIADERWSVGRPGDVITLGDWDCDGRATPAVYRVSTGDVFVFPAWASYRQPVAVEPVGRVPGGVTFADPSTDPSAGPPDPGAGRCDVLAVELPSGAVQPVEPAQ